MALDKLKKLAGNASKAAGIKNQVSEYRNDAKENGVIGGAAKFAKDKLQRKAMAKASRKAMQAAGHAIRGFIGFIVSNPIGWLVGIGLIFLVGSLGSTLKADTRDDTNGIVATENNGRDGSDGSNLTQEEYTALSGGGCAVDTNGKAASDIKLGDGKKGWKIEEVTKFMTSGLGSTWGVKEEVAEGMFLQRNKTVAGRYGLNTSNIKEVTKAVKAEGVSPTFFYLYAINEGGGAGGYINHYFQKDMTGDKIKDATMDAKYLVQQANSNISKPATGGGEPADMPTAEAQKILDQMPKGSVGRVYIAATSATTAELEDLSGKTGSWTKKFGYPISDMMTMITSIDGGDINNAEQIAVDTNSEAAKCDPSIGGDTSSMVSTAKSLIGHLNYSQPKRAQLAKNGKIADIKEFKDVDLDGYADCSSLVWLIAKLAGYNVPDSPWTTSTMAADINGDKKYMKEVPKEKAKAGDIVVGYNGADGHTGVLIEDWHGEDTKIVDIPAPGKKTREGVYKYLFNDQQNGGRGFKVVFAEPIKAKK